MSFEQDWSWNHFHLVGRRNMSFGRASKHVIWSGVEICHLMDWEDSSSIGCSVLCGLSISKLITIQYISEAQFTKGIVSVSQFYIRYLLQLVHIIRPTATFAVKEEFAMST